MSDRVLGEIKHHFPRMNEDVVATRTPASDDRYGSVQPALQDAFMLATLDTVDTVVLRHKNKTDDTFSVTTTEQLREKGPLLASAQIVAIFTGGSKEAVTFLRTESGTTEIEQDAGLRQWISQLRPPSRPQLLALEARRPLNDAESLRATAAALAPATAFALKRIEALTERLDASGVSWPGDEIAFGKSLLAQRDRVANNGGNDKALVAALVKLGLPQADVHDFMSALRGAKTVDHLRTTGALTVLYGKAQAARAQVKAFVRMLNTPPADAKEAASRLHDLVTLFPELRRQTTIFPNGDLLKPSRFSDRFDLDHGRQEDSAARLQVVAFGAQLAALTVASIVFAEVTVPMALAASVMRTEAVKDDAVKARIAEAAGLAPTGVALTHENGITLAAAEGVVNAVTGGVMSVTGRALSHAIRSKLVSRVVLAVADAHLGAASAAAIEALKPGDIDPQRMAWAATWAAGGSAVGSTVAAGILLTFGRPRVGARVLLVAGDDALTVTPPRQATVTHVNDDGTLGLDSGESVKFTPVTLTVHEGGTPPPRPRDLREWVGPAAGFARDALLRRAGLAGEALEKAHAALANMRLRKAPDVVHAALLAAGLPAPTARRATLQWLETQITHSANFSDGLRNAIEDLRGLGFIGTDVDELLRRNILRQVRGLDTQPSHGFDLLADVTDVLDAYKGKISLDTETLIQSIISDLRNDQHEAALRRLVTTLHERSGGQVGPLVEPAEVSFVEASPLRQRITTADALHAEAQPLIGEIEDMLAEPAFSLSEAQALQARALAWLERLARTASR
jgi:hypothetical protein